MKKLFILFIIILTTQSFLFSQIDTINQEEKTESLNKTIDEELFTVVENMPIFDKSCVGEKYLPKCNMEHIRLYFKKALQLKNYKGASGSFDISFIVNTDGSVSNWKKFESGNIIIDEVIKEMPNFYSPGKQRAIPVRVLYKVSVIF